MARKPWDIGNVFAIPLVDGSYSLGQVVGREAKVLNSITCAFFQTRIREGEFDAVREAPEPQQLLALQFTTKDLLTRRVGRVIGNFPVRIPAHLFPHEDKRAQEWIGASVLGSQIMVHFLNAWFGLERWDQMHDPHFFDNLLFRPDLRPQNEP